MLLMRVRSKGSLVCVTEDGHRRQRPVAWDSACPEHLCRALLNRYAEVGPSTTVTGIAPHRVVFNPVVFNSGR